MFFLDRAVTHSSGTWIQTYCVFGRKLYAKLETFIHAFHLAIEQSYRNRASTDHRSFEIVSNSKQSLACINFPFLSILKENNYLSIDSNIISTYLLSEIYYAIITSQTTAYRCINIVNSSVVYSSCPVEKFPCNHAKISCLKITARPVLDCFSRPSRRRRNSRHAGSPGVPLKAVPSPSTCSSKPSRIVRRHFPFLLLVALIVFILYAEILVAFQTTAGRQRICRKSSTLLAVLCLLLATLTIAVRCCASKNAPHPLSKLTSTSATSSSHRTENFDSDNEVRDLRRAHSSKLVLSRVRAQTNTKSDIRLTQANRHVKFLTFHLFGRQNKVKRDVVLTPGTKDLQNQYKRSIFLDAESFDRTDGNVYRAGKIASDKDATNVYPNLFRREAIDNSIEDKKGLVKFNGNDDSFDFLVNPAVVTNSSDNSNLVTTNNSSEDNSSEIPWNRNSNESRTNSDSSEVRSRDKYKWKSGKGYPNDSERPMPPVYEEDSNSLSQSTVLVVVVSSVVLTVALALVTCVLSHYRGGTAADPHDAGQTPTTAPMLSVVSAGAATGVGGMADRLRGHHGHHHGGTSTRDLAASRDRQVRLHAVHTDIAINMPPSIALPDGEDHPYSNARLHIRDSDQESEIYQKCIKPPPNRTVLESESPPPYRSGSAVLLGSIGSSSSSSSSEWSGGNAPLVVRCHSMSSTTKRPEVAGPSGQKTDFIQRTVKIFTGKKSQPPPAPSLPVVIVPTRPRNISEQQQQQHQQQQNSTGRPKPSI